MGFQRRQMCSHAILQKSASLVCAQVECWLVLVGGSSSAAEIISDQKVKYLKDRESVQWYLLLFLTLGFTSTLTVL